MKVKATTSFAGEICMAVGETRDVPESIAAPLMRCGYLEMVEEKPQETAPGEPQENSDDTPKDATESKKSRAKK